MRDLLIQLNLLPGVSELYTHLNGIIENTHNVVQLGPLSKEAYYRHLSESSLMLYPCTFPEISCIAALEAQACRTPIVTTDAFALTETALMTEFKISGQPGSDHCDSLFVERVLEFLNFPERTADLAVQARRAIEGKYTWPAIAAEWDRLFDLALASRQRALSRPASGIEAPQNLTHTASPVS